MAILKYYSNSISRRSLRWLVFGFSAYCVYACVAEFLAALISSLNWNRNYLKIVPALLVAVMLTTPVQGEDIPQEYQVKANYLLNFPLFMEFPPHPQSCTSFKICIMGETPIGKAMQQFKEKQIKRRLLEIEKILEPDQMGCCQVLFIASSEQYRLQRLLAEANRRGILTVSDMRNFARLGGMVNLVTINNRITFSLNHGAARSASISFGTKLLRLANDVSN